MDEKEIINGILTKDSDITIISEEERISYFKLWEFEYGIFYFNKEERDKFPIIVIRNYEKYDYPHILTHNCEIDGCILRSVCLYESDKIIKYLYSYEEKIVDIIERLKQLLQLTEREKEREFQKEFLYYWNKEAESWIDVLLGDNKTFQRLNLYQEINNDNNMRLVSAELRLNNKERYKHIPNIECFYIPITDNRRLLPPVKEKPWTIIDIMNIVDGKPYSRIRRNTYDKMSEEKCKSKTIFLCFEMTIKGQGYNFGTMVEFTDQVKDSLLNRINRKVKKITPVMVRRCDYNFLNKQIGNDTNIIGKKVAIIGCGSLGSYVAEELVKVGIKNISLYDNDIVNYENILRHKAQFNWSGYKKVTCMKSRLESIHPEVLVDINGNITDELLIENIDKYDLIIFAAGSSDVQLASNQVFRRLQNNKPVIYVWLEAGGTHSHILTVDYSKRGCFECLFTDNNGEMRNNKANKLSIEIEESYVLSNGCGATRVAYGASILLRTTSVILDTVQKLFNGDITENSLIDITPTNITNTGNSFVERKCNCCGN